MGALEIAAALRGVINAVLVVRRSTWNYPFGIVMAALYFFIFAHAKLYSDALPQIFFFVIQIDGSWAWSAIASIASPAMPSCFDALVFSRSNFIEIRGRWDERFDAAIKAIDALVSRNGLKWPEARAA